MGWTQAWRRIADRQSLIAGHPNTVEGIAT
jgi:hypothetical protein